EVTDWRVSPGKSGDRSAGCRVPDSNRAVVLPRHGDLFAVRAEGDLLGARKADQRAAGGQNQTSLVQPAGEMEPFPVAEFRRCGRRRAWIGSSARKRCKSAASAPGVG